jgi:hypothetical protein
MIADAMAGDNNRHAPHTQRGCTIPHKASREERQTYLASLGHLRHNDTIDPA